MGYGVYGSMTERDIYDALDKGGSFSLPYLVQFIAPGYETIYLVNNNEDIVYLGNTYKAAAFKYTPPKVKGGVVQGGSLDVSVADNSLSAWADLATHTMSVNAVGILKNGTDVEPLSFYRHQYGSVTINNGYQMQMSFTNDDRLSMTFPPVVFDNENNPGNA